MNTTLTQPQNKLDLPPETVRLSMSSRKKNRGSRGGRSLLAKGEPMLWLSGGGLVIAIVMIIALMGLIIVQGVVTFWPTPVKQFILTNGNIYTGEVTRLDHYKPEAGILDSLSSQIQQEIADADGYSNRHLVRTGNFDLTNTHFHWAQDFNVQSTNIPQWATVIERNTWGRFYGTPKAFIIDGKTVANTPQTIWGEYLKHHDQIRERWHTRKQLEKHDIGDESRKLDDARLQLRQALLDFTEDSQQYREAKLNYDAIEAQVNVAYAKIRVKIDALNNENDKYQLLMVTDQGQEKKLPLAEIVRAYLPNQISFSQKINI
ncbi:MAG: hypothetical protein JKX85_09170, partial [Phycisphaeraceae bacterium]|nr:hypothetical protein [Phycisphaeraceae bacterium]